MPTNPANLEIPDDVVELLRSGKCIAYLGSGLSHGIFPSWPVLVNELCDSCGSDRRVGDSSRPDELLDAAQEALDTDDKAYYKRLHEIFGVTHLTNPLYGILLQVDFKSYITVNFDRLLIDVARLNGAKCSRLMKYPHLDRQFIGSRTVYHIHGLIEDDVIPNRDTIVLSRSEFGKAYGENGSVKRFLLDAFLNDPVCFIGCELREPALKEVFQICKVQQETIRDLGGGQPPKRYIFLPRRAVSVSSQTSRGDADLDSVVMPTNPANLEIPDDVVELLRSGKCIAYLGSGLSHGIFPSWPVLVNELCDSCGSDRRVGDSSRPDELLDAAQEALDTDDKAYYKRLHEIFGVTHLTNPLYGILLQVDFKSYITVNFDRLLIDVARLNGAKCSRLMKYPHLDRQFIGSRTVYHIHGLIEDDVIPNRDTIVLSRSEFGKAYGENGSVKRFLLDAFLNDPVCFIGCELREPALKEVFQICKVQQETIRDLGGGQPPKRYIFLPRRAVSVSSQTSRGDAEERSMADEDYYYSRYDITVVRYDPVDDVHSGLRKQFELIAGIPEIRRKFGFAEEGIHGS